MLPLPEPEMPPPVALAQVRELHLHPMRRPSLDAPHEVADGNMRRDFHEHMDMFSRQNAGYDLDAQFSAHQPDNRSYPLPQRAFQHLVAILRDPDDVIPMVKNRVTPACVAHRLTDPIGVVAEERLPALGWRSPAPCHVFGHRGLGN